MFSDERQEEGSASNTWNLKRDKAFKQLISSQATTYDGTNCMEYRPWKDELEREASNLHFTPSQGLQLLGKRTTGNVPRHSNLSANQQINCRTGNYRRPSCNHMGRPCIINALQFQPSDWTTTTLSTTTVHGTSPL